MNGKDRINRINKMATAPEKHRSHWHIQAAILAGEVKAEIARLRTFAGHVQPYKSGCVADYYNGIANELEAELKAAMAKFEQKHLVATNLEAQTERVVAIIASGTSLMQDGKRKMQKRKPKQSDRQPWESASIATARSLGLS